MMNEENEFNKFKRKQGELINNNVPKTFFNGKESWDDAIIKDVNRILKKYDITLDKLIHIVNPMQETNTNNKEDYKNEE